MSRYHQVILILFLSIFFFFSLSQNAIASTKTSLSHNGAGSHNSVTTTNANVFTTIQTNFANIVNIVTSSSNTGNNTVSGGGSITTGNATSKVTVVNIVNSDAPVSVPEFGFIPGVIATLSSGGIFLFLRKRYI